jgi:hypothetical protein
LSVGVTVMQADIGGATLVIRYVGRRRTHGRMFAGAARATVLAGIAVLIGAAIGFGVLAEHAHPGLLHLTTFPSVTAGARAL